MDIMPKLTLQPTTFTSLSGNNDITELELPDLLLKGRETISTALGVHRSDKSRLKHS